MLIKKGFQLILKSVLLFFVFVILYLLFAFLFSRITIEKESNTSEDIQIFIKTNGVHTDIVVPIKSELYDWSKELKFENTISKDSNFNYVAMGWGDKGFYLETPEWKDLKASVAFKAAFGLSTSAIHTTFYKQLKENETCKKIKISNTNYK